MIAAAAAAESHADTGEVPTDESALPPAKRTKLPVDFATIATCADVPWNTREWNLELAVRDASDAALVKLPVHTMQLDFLPYFDALLSSRWNATDTTMSRILDLSESEWNLTVWVPVLDCCYKIPTLSGGSNDELIQKFWAAMWKSSDRAEVAPFQLACYLTSLEFGAVFANASCADSKAKVVSLLVRISQTHVGAWQPAWLRNVLRVADSATVNFLATECFAAVVAVLNSMDSHQPCRELPSQFVGPMEILIVLCGLIRTECEEFWQHLTGLLSTEYGAAIERYCWLDGKAADCVDHAFGMFCMFLPCFDHAVSKHARTSRQVIHSDIVRERWYPLSSVHCIRNIKMASDRPRDYNMTWGRLRFAVKLVPSVEKPLQPKVDFFDYSSPGIWNMSEHFHIFSRVPDQDHPPCYRVHCSSYALSWKV